MSSGVRSQKIVASALEPLKQATFEARHSIKWPMVIHEGIACGFIIKSGVIPSMLNGMFSYQYTIPHVPFCPCHEANLSPI